MAVTSANMLMFGVLKLVQARVPMGMFMLTAFSLEAPLPEN
jgi:hypothetical protein